MHRRWPSAHDDAFVQAARTATGGFLPRPRASGVGGRRRNGGPTSPRPLGSASSPPAASPARRCCDSSGSVLRRRRSRAPSRSWAPRHRPAPLGARRACPRGDARGNRPPHRRRASSRRPSRCASRIRFCEPRCTTSFPAPSARRPMRARHRCWSLRGRRPRMLVNISCWCARRRCCCARDLARRGGLGVAAGRARQPPSRFSGARSRRPASRRCVPSSSTQLGRAQMLVQDVGALTHPREALRLAPDAQQRARVAVDLTQVLGWTAEWDEAPRAGSTARLRSPPGRPTTWRPTSRPIAPRGSPTIRAASRNYDRRRDYLLTLAERVGGEAGDSLALLLASVSTLRGERLRDSASRARQILAGGGHVARVGGEHWLAAAGHRRPALQRGDRRPPMTLRRPWRRTGSIGGR